MSGINKIFAREIKQFHEMEKEDSKLCIYMPVVTYINMVIVNIKSEVAMVHPHSTVWELFLFKQTL